MIVWSWAAARQAVTLAHMAVMRLDEARRRRTYAGEEVWFPLLETFGPSKLRRAFIACGVPPRVAGNLVWFLEDQATLDRHLDPTTGVKYRRVLRELKPEEVGRAARTIPG